MAIRDVLKNLTGKKESAEQPNALLSCDQFPIIHASDVELSRYRKIPLAGIAALGGAFSQMPLAARTITQSVETTVPFGRQLFVGIPPDVPNGFLRLYGNGISGNVLRINEQGKSVVAGRIRFQPIGSQLPVTETTATTIPFDPTTLVIAAAMFRVEQKLTALQEKAEEILQFLSLDKQAKQRGNLSMLNETLEEYKLNCNNEVFCSGRSQTVLSIRKEAYQDLIFYQDRIAQKLRDQKLVHDSQKVQLLLDSLVSEMTEYQLACYLYSFSTFLDIMLQKAFHTDALQAAADRIHDQAQKYDELYSECHAQIANYQRSSINAKLLGGLGNAARHAGQKLADLPLISKTPVDEALTSAGEALIRHNKEALVQKLEQMIPLKDHRTQLFEDNLHTLDLMHNQPNGMLTDGENLYILETA